MEEKKIKLRSFDMENFVKANRENSELTLKYLRDDNLWLHFENLNNFYDDLFQAQTACINAPQSANTITLRPA